MLEIGNLIVNCARRNDVGLNVYKGIATVFVGSGPDRTQLEARWDDNEAVSKIVRELNFGKYSHTADTSENEPVFSLWLCYEENSSHLAAEAGAVNALELFFSKESKEAWIRERLAQATEDDFFVDKEVTNLEEKIEHDDFFVTVFRGHQENWNESYDIIAKKADVRL